jgi:hypothetical protein
MRRACGAGSWGFSSRPDHPLAAIAMRSCARALAALSARSRSVRGGGVWVERWLFFAEARHVSMLYYGATLGGAEAPAQ